MERERDIMRFFYDVIFIIFSLVYVPTFLVKLVHAESKSRLLCDRCGFLSNEFMAYVAHKNVIWIHAVSVGEVLAISQFIDLMAARFPHHQIILSTVTPTGNRLARKMMQGKAAVFYFPFDVSFIARRVMRRIRPQLLILTETELWPNVILAAVREGVKVVVVNGRLSPRSFRRYYAVQRLLHTVLEKVHLFLVQTHAYARRLEKIGVARDRIVVTGNMKFDGLLSAGHHDMSRERCERGFSSADTVLILASSHRGEEAMMVRVVTRLRFRWPLVKLLIAPRHVERAQEIVRMLNREKLSVRCALPVAAQTHAQALRSEMSFDVYLLNTIGDLKKIYGVGAVVVMGGSFINHGGQNPLEALVYNVPVISGPSVFNFGDIYAQLIERKAAYKVRNEHELYERLCMLLSHPEYARDMGMKGAALIEEMKGATARTVELVQSLVVRT